MFITEGGIE